MWDRIEDTWHARIYLLLPTVLVLLAVAYCCLVFLTVTCYCLLFPGVNCCFILLLAVAWCCLWLLSVACSCLLPFLIVACCCIPFLAIAISYHQDPQTNSRSRGNAIIYYTYNSMQLKVTTSSKRANRSNWKQQNWCNAKHQLATPDNSKRRLVSSIHARGERNVHTILVPLYVTYYDA